MDTNTNMNVYMFGTLVEGFKMLDSDKTNRDTDLGYFQNFYNSQKKYCKDIDKEFIVDIHNLDGGQRAIYYTLLCRHKVYGNRAGAVWGLSIRIDGHYIRDVAALYELFKTIFRTKVLGTILKQTKDGLAYERDFNDDDLKSIAEFACKRIKEDFPLELSTIGKDFGTRKTEPTEIFGLYEIDNDILINKLKENLKLHLTPAPVERDKDKVKREQESSRKGKDLRDENTKLSKELGEVKKEIKNLTAEKTTLRKENEKQKDIITQHESTISKKDSEIEKLTIYKELVETINTAIKDRMCKLKVVPYNSSDQPEPQPKSNPWIMWIITWALIIAAIVTPLFQPAGDSQADKKEIAELKKSKEALISQIKWLTITNDSPQYSGTVDEAEKVSPGAATPPNPRIDVDNYCDIAGKERLLEKGKQYTINIKDVANPSDYDWDVKAGDEGKKTSGKLSVNHPATKETITLYVYKKGNKSSVLKERVLRIKQQ